MQDQIKIILDQYEIVEKSPIVLVRESSDNLVYCIGESNKKILRISKRLPLSDIKFEFDVMEHLSKSGVPLPRWIKTKNKSFYSYTSEISTAILFEFLDGVHVERTIEHMPSLEQAHEAGAVLAALHSAGQSFVSGSYRSRTVFTELERVINNKDIFIKDFEGGEKFVQEVQEALIFAKKFPEPKGFIHNDYRVGNVFFDKNVPAKINGVIDFDWGCIGPISKDFAHAIVEWSFVDGNSAPDEAVFGAFLEGYNSKATYPQSKGNILYQWIWYSGLSDTATWLCDNLTTPDFVKKIARSYMYQKAQYYKLLIV